MGASGFAAPAAGFTLIEMLVVLGLLAAIASLGLFADMGAYERGTLGSERDSVVSLLDRARSRSMNNLYDAPHGFCFDGAEQAYIVYRDREREEAQRAQQGIAIEGIPACGEGGIVFSQLSGTTTDAIIILSKGAQTYRIEVNEEGAILW